MPPPTTAPGQQAAHPTLAQGVMAEQPRGSPETALLGEPVRALAEPPAVPAIAVPCGRYRRAFP